MNRRTYSKGDEVPWYSIYPFFLIHMLVFAGSGFVMAYGEKDPPLFFMYLHGGLAITIYTAFYRAIFGADEIKWMFINAGLGLLGLYTEIGWILSFFNKKIGDYPPWVHVTPFLYFVLYTFLLRQAILDLLGARENEDRKKMAGSVYVAFSVAAALASYLFQQV